MKKTLYRTVIKIEVLSEEPIEHSMSLNEIQSECDEGDYSGSWDTVVSNQPISGKAALKLTLAQGSSPDFFSMDKEGNELDE